MITPYWTKERVDQSLRLLFEQFNEAPVSARRYDELCGQAGDKGKQGFDRQFPSRPKILSHYSSLTDAWVALGLLDSSAPKPRTWSKKKKIDAAYLEQLAASGMFSKDIYIELGMSDGTFYKLLKDHPDLREAFDRGRAQAKENKGNSKSLVRHSAASAVNARRQQQRSVSPVDILFEQVSTQRDALEAAQIELAFSQYWNQPSNKSAEVQRKIADALAQSAEVTHARLGAR